MSSRSFFSGWTILYSNIFFYDRGVVAMTVFCWDGVTLATDSRRTVRKTTHYDDSRKLRTRFGSAYFQGARIRATARAGDRRQTRLMSQALKTAQEGIDRIRRLWDEGVLSREKKGALFVVTDDKRWLIRVAPAEGVSLKEVTGQLTFAGGSGGLVGKFLMDVYGLSAQDAVRITKQYQKCCGGPTQFIRFDGAPLEVVKQPNNRELTLHNETISWFADVAERIRGERNTQGWPRDKVLRIEFAAGGPDAQKFLMFEKNIKEILRISEITPSAEIQQGFAVLQ